MANTYRAVHCFQGQGGTTDDMYCNQFYFYSATNAPGDVSSWGPVLAACVHNLWVAGVPGASLSRYYHPRCLGNLGVTKIYDVTGNPATAGPPIFVITDETLIPSAEYLIDCVDTFTPLPEEVSLCLSYQAVHTDGNLPRRRGRIYLGPLNVEALDDSDNMAPSRPSTALWSSVVPQAALNLQASALAAGFEWRVFSTMDGFAFTIVSFSCDNAFDTVRGRGTSPSGKSTVTV